MPIEANTDALIQELEQFKKEKEQIRKLIGQIGGSKANNLDKITNIIFIVALCSLFSLDLLRHVFGVHVPIPSMLSLEMGLLLISIKIIWMIHKQTKVEHFQFWILNSIEFRLNEISKEIRSIEKKPEQN
ncbi:MAG: hypothetical protein P9X22_04465 [Candidatus Zapsychrus exili]|nr:hypothetical protein [Candidatus Zapsychrus exili]